MELTDTLGDPEVTGQSKIATAVPFGGAQRGDAGTAEITRRLGSTIIDYTDFRDTPLQEDIDYLQRHGGGVHIFLKLPPKEANLQPGEMSILGLPDAAPASRITLTLDHVSVLDAFH